MPYYDGPYSYGSGGWWEFDEEFEKDNRYSPQYGYGSYYGGYGGKNYYGGYYDYYSSYYSSRKSIEPSKLENIVQDSFDRLMFQDVKAINPKVGDTIRTGKWHLSSFEELARDLFCDLYKNDPILKEEPPEGTLLNRKIVKEFMENPNTELLRDYTVYDDFYAGCASVSALNEIIERIKNDDELRELAQKQNQIQNMDDGADKEQAIKEFGDAVESCSSKIRDAVSKSVSSSIEETKKTNDIMDFFGCSKDVAGLKMKPEDKFNLLEEWEKIKGMAKYIGRYKQLAESANLSNKRSKTVELCDIDIGDDIMHALPTEQMLMLNPLLRVEFFRRFVEKQLMQYNYKRDIPSGRGPIIALLDDSGSMYNDNESAVKARGALFGLIEVAKKEKRDIGICIFSSGDDMSSFLIEKGKTNPEQILQILSVNYGGGTNYYKPLRWALDLAKKSLFKESDIVMITDGDCYMNDEQLENINKLKKERDLRTSVVLLNDEGYIGSDLDDNLKEWADEVYTDDNDTTFESIFKSM